MEKKCKKLLDLALNALYKSEVIETGMVPHIIGNGNDYRDKEDWKQCKLSELKSELPYMAVLYTLEIKLEHPPVLQEGQKSLKIRNTIEDALTEKCYLIFDRGFTYKTSNLLIEANSISELREDVKRIVDLYELDVKFTLRKSVTKKEGLCY